MRQFLVVTILIITASACFAQATTPSAPSGTAQPTAPDASMPAANQAPANDPGQAPVTPSSPTGPTTPSVTLGNTSASPVGASNATPGNQVGATNSTLQPAGTSGNASQTTSTTPAVGNTSTSASIGASGNNASSDRNFIGGSDSAWAISTNTLGVAEAARLARAARAGHKSRVFTNADIARFRSDAPVSVVGNPITPPAANEQTMPASDVDEQVSPTTPVAPVQGVEQPANQNPPPGAPKSPFRSKPSPIQPR